MRQEFETVIKHLLGAADDSLVKINIPDQFRPDEETDQAIPRNLNAAFLITLCGESHPLYEEADQYLSAMQNNPRWKEMIDFFRNACTLIHSEIMDLWSRDKDFKKKLQQLHAYLEDKGKKSASVETMEKMREVFFPEGFDICNKRPEKIMRLREKRKVTISHLNPDPVKDPSKEILFTSNILITVSPRSRNINHLPFNSSLMERIKDIGEEDQLYWYDHPIQIGVEQEKNETIYGLEALEYAAGFEKKRGTIAQDAKVPCVLSVSTTHKGLQEVAKEYLEEEFSRRKGIQHLDVYLLTEKDTQRLIEEILIPAAKRYLMNRDIGILKEIIGVDGEYGRHYSFLKAMAAFWQVFIDPAIKGTFKIDLDQVFPQNELVEYTGKSAFEHLMTPLWGAVGIDHNGSEIELGMIAGSLVNERDISTSLFTPDVCFPPDQIKGDELIFLSALPQALSTEAEMMTRYTENTLNGKDYCLQRIHVTGGTCGILVDSLRRHRPFTPTFIGRAEDQAYLLSVLFKNAQNNLRYVHEDGLIMRHDKESFAQEAIQSAYVGKLIGDYVRVLWFSFYAEALPWPREKIKELIDPFTGCFVSPMPFTIVHLRLALKAASLLTDENAEQYNQGLEILKSGTHRLQSIIQMLIRSPNPLRERYYKEKEGWDIYYDLLDQAEKGLKKDDPFSLEMQKKARKLVNDCRTNF